MLRSLFVILLLFSFQGLSAQSLHSKRKKAIANYEKALEISNVGNIYESEKLLIALLKKDKSFDEAILLLHQVYLRRDLPAKSEQVLADYASALEQPFINRVLSDQANYHFELGNYVKAKGLLDDIDGRVYQIPEKVSALLKASIEFAFEQSKNPIEIEFEKLPEPLNRFERQYFPSISAKGQLVFTVRENNGRGDENLYMSSLVNNQWTDPEPIASSINTDRNEGTASISADGSTLVFTACNIPGNIGSCDLYISYFDGSSWKKPELLSAMINSPDWDSQPALSRDGKKLYFVSRRPGGLGRQDIWVSEKGNEGWNKAQNMGPQINTPYDDCSPYIYVDEKTLFFASKGRTGMGGFDLFTSKNEKGEWAAPENLGAPINNSFDQVGYSVSPKGWAYYSSAEANGKIELNRFKVPETVISMESIDFITGTVLDANTKRPVKSSIESFGSALVTTDSITGEFTAFVRLDSVVLGIKAAKYEFRELSGEEFNLLDNGEILLTPYSIGQNIEFGSIYFDLNSAVIKLESDSALTSVLTHIRNNPLLVIEIGGHTDAVGGEKENLGLSLERALSVYRYFIRKGVPKENLVYKGYGEDHPKTSGKTEEERKKNRRIEFRVVDILK